MKRQEYFITAKIELECDISVVADSLGDALHKSAALKIDDFIDSKGELVDYDLRIKGLFEA